MSAQPIPVAITKADWVHQMRMLLVNLAKKTGMIHIGMAHKMVLDGVMPPPGSNRWMSDVMKVSYFRKNGAVPLTCYRKYNKRTGLFHMWDLDFPKFLQNMADHTSTDPKSMSPMEKMIMSDCSQW